MSTRITARGDSSPQAEREAGHVGEMQRRRLSLAMVEVLAEYGLEDASIGRVCKRAGVSRRTFYELFDDRDECFLAAFEMALERIAPGVLAAWQGVGSWRERVRGTLAVLLEQFDAEPDVARVCVIETLKAGAIVCERRAGVLAMLVDAVEEGRGESRQGGEPPPLTGQGVVGGVLSVIHASLLASPSHVADDPRKGAAQVLGGDGRLVELTGSLAAMIVHPYLGPAAARRELERPMPVTPGTVASGVRDPFKDLSIRFTYRTARVLATVAADPGASNRLIADNSGVGDEGQMSRLLARLQSSGLIENHGNGQIKGKPNAWQLTQRGRAVHTALTG